jgi:hypothetical protein
MSGMEEEIISYLEDSKFVCSHVADKTSSLAQ